MRNRPKGFTLSEMLVVMGIIVLFVALAIPTIRGMTGSASIQMARNSISALLARAREEAIAVQDVRGVMFIVDKTTNRMQGVLVQAALIQDVTYAPNTILLDAVPNRDTVQLPAGVRLQAVYNGVDPTKSMASTPKGDRYLGFNIIPGTEGPSAPPSLIGPVILFDGNGMLIARPYGFQMSQPDPTNAATGTKASNLALLLRIDKYPGYPAFSTYENVGPVPPTPPTPAAPSVAYVFGYIPGTPPTKPPISPVLSQTALILFDYDAFKSLGFTDQDADIVSTSSSAYTTAWLPIANRDGDGIHSEADEETWLDNNSTPLLVNRYDGTLIRGE